MNVTWHLVLMMALSIMTGHSASADDTPSKDGNIRYAELRVELRSWIRGEERKTLRMHSSSTCSNGGSVGTGVGGESGFNVTVRCIPDLDRIAAEVSISPSKANKTLQASELVVDMSNMRTSYLLVSKDEDNRSYVLSIEPEVIEEKPPKAFTIEDLLPFDWDFPQSPVVLNDEIYVGRIGMSGGSLVGIAIAGIADLKFSLRQLKDAEPTGVLQHGTLTIKTKNDVIVISGVRNGANKLTLQGPYKVWVRSTGENVSNDEYKRLMNSQLDAIQKRKAEGDASITDEAIERIKSFVNEGRPMLIGSSARDVRDSDLVK
ncbi:hypothetical protein K227x_54170 [Rubripirellula lacrimiformis]|uniref:Uncharacterized protein n=1 Tax=Rubripirellula lacrimiformis TaxID=1930273 RepID=A0A517NIX0_9BACT|nr:hypothetical protein K227x_54170 [Rubripirellula lacrimiformis]